MPQDKPFSELLFEEYLALQGLGDFEFEKEWEGILQRPDYTVYHNDKVYIFDVKEFEIQPAPAGLSFRDPYSRIRQKIDTVRAQFKCFKDRPCCLVLYSDDPLVEVYNWIIVLSAMYGDFGRSIPFDPGTGTVSDPGKHAFTSGGKMFRIESSRSQNTTVSALISLRRIPIGQIRARLAQSLGNAASFAPESEFRIEETQPSVIVWENAFARVKFPRDLFAGRYDERWGGDGSVITRVFAGEGVLACEKLLAEES